MNKNNEFDNNYVGIKILPLRPVGRNHGGHLVEEMGTIITHFN